MANTATIAKELGGILGLDFTGNIASGLLTDTSKAVLAGEITGQFTGELIGYGIGCCHSISL